MNFKKEIILPSWKIIALDDKVKKMYFLPGILGILFLTVILIYQTVYTYIVIVGKENEAFNLILHFFETSYFWEIIIIALILLLLYIFLVPVFEGALIKYIDRKEKEGFEKNISTSDVLGVGLYKFLPIFEYDQMFSKFRFLSIINFYLFTLRLVGIEYITQISWGYLLIFIFSMFINIFFSYTKYEIVLENKKVFEAIGNSSKIAILNLKTTAKLYFLIFLLNFRVIFNFIILLIFPFLISLAIGFFTTKIFLTISIIILTILFLILIAFISYLSAVLEIFTTSLWYYAWKSGKDKVSDVEKK
ncbi:MAG: hypothetical protein Q9M94_04440 [Candidatus Gracilibacteria bacterium]|nr:hypothetical protein [Candidatus Gracilibacteria bacterium]MDQ7022510.1 hypothetical protein [Candidatus Gracilibacteria bacterium]